MVADAVAVHVVVVGVRIPVEVLPREERGELVTELIRDGGAELEQVRLEAKGVEDVVEVREVRVFPLETLLDVGVLVDDSGLERREVGGGRSREVVREGLLERRGARGAERVVRRVDPGDRREVEAEPRQVGREVDDLEVQAGGLSRANAGQRHLDVGPLILSEVGDRQAAILGRRGRHDQHPVVVRLAVVRGVIDVEVEEPGRVDGRERRRDGQLLLLRRAVRGGDVRPPARLVEVDPEIVDAELVRAARLPRQVVVEQDSAPREEAAEVDHRPLECRYIAAGGNPLDRDDLLARALRSLTERVRLEHAGRGEAGRAVEARIGEAMERVVHRAVHAGPRAGGERRPADPRVRREALHEPVPSSDAFAHELAIRRHVPVTRVVLHEIRSHAVGCKEDDLVG